jgi:hypothetical protein
MYKKQRGARIMIEVEGSMWGLVAAFIALMVIVATILTAINTARTAETLKRIEQLLNQRKSD